MSARAESILHSVIESLRAAPGPLSDRAVKKRRALLALMDRMLVAAAPLNAAQPSAVQPSAIEPIPFQSFQAWVSRGRGGPGDLPARVDRPAAKKTAYYEGPVDEPILRQEIRLWARFAASGDVLTLPLGVVVRCEHEPPPPSGPTAYPWCSASKRGVFKERAQDPGTLAAILAQFYSGQQAAAPDPIPVLSAAVTPPPSPAGPGPQTVYTTNPTNQSLAGLNYITRADGADKFITRGTEFVVTTAFSYLSPKFGKVIVPVGARGTVLEVSGDGTNAALGKYRKSYGKAFWVQWQEVKPSADSGQVLSESGGTEPPVSLSAVASPPSAPGPGPLWAALHSEGADKRWQRLREKGATDADLQEAIEKELGKNPWVKIGDGTQLKGAALIQATRVLLDIPTRPSGRTADSGQVLRALSELSGDTEVPVPLSALRPRFAALDPVLSMLASEGAIVPLARQGFTAHPEAYWKDGVQIIDRVIPTTYDLDIARSMSLAPGEPRPVYHRDLRPDRPGADLIAALLAVPTTSEEAGRLPLGADRAHRPAELADDAGTQVFAEVISGWHEGSLAAYQDAAAWLRALGVRARPVAQMMEREAAALELRHLRLPAHLRETYARRLGNIGADRGDLYTLLTGAREVSARFIESQQDVEQWVLHEMGDQPVYEGALNDRLKKSPHGSASASEAIDALIARGEVSPVPANKAKGEQAGLVRIRAGVALPPVAKPKRGPVQRATIYHLGLIGQVVREEGRDYDAAEGTWQNATARGRRKGYQPRGEPWLLVLGGWDHPTFDDAQGQHPLVAAFDVEMAVYLESHPEVRVLADYRPMSPASARIEAPPAAVSETDRALFKSVLDRHWQAMGQRTAAPDGVVVRGDEVGVLLKRVYVQCHSDKTFSRRQRRLPSLPWIVAHLDLNGS